MRIILVTDPPWAVTANSRQMAHLAKRLRDDLHTVYWMPTWGFSDGGEVDWNGITVIAGDDRYGNEIIKHHVRMRAAHLVITRGWAENFTSYGGSDFAWWAWHPGPQPRKILRKAIRRIAVSEHDAHELESISGVIPDILPRPATDACWKMEPEMAEVFRFNHRIPEDSFMASAIGPQNPHWKRMMDAWKLFSERHPEAVLYMHTEGQSPLDLVQYASDIGLSQDNYRIPDGYNFHVGYYDNSIAAMYRASDVHLVPGLAVQPAIEAMASGVPVLATDRPELREFIPVEGLGSLVAPITVHEQQPLLDVDRWVEELELCYEMDAKASANHSACCQIAVKDRKWLHAYEEWQQLLSEFEQEENERAAANAIDAPTSKRDSRLIEDLGYVEEHGCEVVRKTDIGGSTQDEERQNKIVRAWGEHPNIITILEEGYDKWDRYYFDTPKLAPLVDVKGFTPEQGNKILADIRAGLSFMHQHGAAHCDINPRNILLTDTKKEGDEYVIGPDMRAVIFDFDFMQSGLPPELASLCDYDPLNPLALPYAVPVMQSGLATRGFHRVVTYVKNLPFEGNAATSKRDMPYQQIEGVGERDCDQRWSILKPDVHGKRVVDLGCNLGYFAARSIKEGAASVEAYDRDEAIIKSAQVLHPELDGKAFVMNFDDALPEGEYDVAFCMSVWQHTRAGKRPLLDFLLNIPTVYWEDANMNRAELEHLGFEAERIATSERGRNLFKLTRKAVLV